jgi:PAS domain S-box-containing protein
MFNRKRFIGFSTSELLPNMCSEDFVKIGTYGKAGIGLLGNEEQLQTLFNAIPDFVLFKDGEGRWLKVNQAGKDRFQLHDFQYKGKMTSEIAEMVPAFREDPLMSEYSDEMVWEKKETLKFEQRIRLPDQSVRLVEITKIPVFDSKENKQGRKGMLVISRDITEQKRIEQVLGFAAKAYKYIKDGVILTDEKTIIQSVNDSFTRVTGYQLEEAIGKEICFCSMHIHEKEFFETMWKMVEEEGHWQGDIWGQRKNGEIYSKHLTLSSIKDNNGTVTNYIGIINDITEREKLRNDILKTGKIQRKLLPPPIIDQRFEMATIYQPKRYVSGDFYDYLISEDKQKLTGFVMDFMGHGLSTAIQASALRVLFHQMSNLYTPLCKRVEWLNKESIKYFNDETFAAAIFYEFDFQHMKLTITAAGINYFLCHTKDREPLVKVEGTFLGIMEHASFEQLTIPIHQGDHFLFLSDGLLDGISNEFEEVNQGFQDAINTLNQILNLQKEKDDCSAVCFHMTKI